MEAKQMAQEACAVEKLYYEDSYMKKFTAKVLSCEADGETYRVVLERTAFFPEGGGQAGDRGWLNGVPVLDTREKPGSIWHVVPQAFEPGTEVEGEVDFDLRFDRMQQHTAEHIVSGIVHAMCGYDNVGFHLGDEITTLDFSGELSAEQVQEVEYLANRAVHSNLFVEIQYPSKEELKTLDYRSKIEIEGQVRLVSIPGVDVCACCAPHTKTTGELGLIKLLSCDRHRGGCRVVMVSGMRALADYNKKQRSVTDVSVELSAKPEEIGDAVRNLKRQQMKLREQLNQIQAVYLKEKLDAIRPEDSCVCIFEEEMDTVAVRNFVNDAVERCSGICAAFVGSDKAGYRYILGSRTINLREFAKVLNGRFQGKGGGKPEMIQGSLFGTREELQGFLAENSKAD